MKIAFISDAAFPWHMGGLEVVELAEARELAKKHEVHFFSMRWKGMERDFVKDRIHYHTSGYTTKETFYRHGRRSIRVALLFMLSTFRIFKYRFDVIEVNMFPFIHLPIVKLFCKLTGCKMILDVVEVWSKRYWTEYLGGFVGRLAYWYTNYFCMSSDAYLVNSTITEAKLNALDIGSHRIFRFAPVIDDKLIDRIKREKLRKEQRIFFWGRLIKEKRIDKWLEMFKEVNKKLPEVRGLIGGGGPEKENIEKMVHGMGLGKVVTIAPYIDSDTELYREFAKSSLLLHMSEREGMSVLSLQSLALGVPVVLPSYTPIPKEIREMCVVEDEKKIPGKIVEIMKSKDKAKYIKNVSTLKDYYFSNVNPFYNGVFKKLFAEKR